MPRGLLSAEFLEQIAEELNEAVRLFGRLKGRPESAQVVPRRKTWSAMALVKLVRKRSLGAAPAQGAADVLLQAAETIGDEFVAVELLLADLPLRGPGERRRGISALEDRM